MSAIPPPPRERTAFAVLDSRNNAVDLALWQVLRDVLLWTRTPPERRRALFRAPNRTVRERMAEAADAVPLLADPLAALSRLRETPGEAAPETVALACDQIHEWAERTALRAVAAHFAEAAAYAEPGNPRWCIHSGYITRMAGGLDLLARSEMWYSRAYVLAVQQREREMALRALIGAGALMADRGEYARARRLYVTAARRAVRHGRKRRAAVALHYAFMVDVETEHYRVAVRDAKAALRNYPLHDERIPALAHDVAYLLVRNHHHAAALRLVDRLGERVEGVAAMGMLYGMAARAAAGAGREKRYKAAAEAAFNVAQVSEDCAGPVYVNLAEAARFRGRWEEAEEHARRALAVAQRRADAEVQRLTVELLRKMEQREAPPPATEPPSGAPIAALARRLAARVRRWRRYNRGAGAQV